MKIQIKNLAVGITLAVHFLSVSLVCFLIPPTQVMAQAPLKVTSHITLPLASNTSLVIENKNGAESQTVLVSDNLSSTKVILSSDGSTISTPAYYPYGTSTTSLNLDKTSRYYTNQRKVDDESDLYNYNARYYNPDTSVFIQPDSVEGPARYTYVSGNPLQLFYSRIYKNSNIKLVFQFVNNPLLKHYSL